MNEIALKSRLKLVLYRCGLCRACGEFAIDAFDRDMRATPPRTALPPSRLILQRDSPDIKVSNLIYYSSVLSHNEYRLES